MRVDGDAVDLARLKAGAPLLDSHNADSGVRAALGVVDDAWIDGRYGLARVRFAERAVDVFDDVAAGVLRGVSVGYTRDAVERTDEKINGLPVREITKWTPHEISLVLIPADAGAQIRSKAMETEMPDNQATTPPNPNSAERERARVSGTLDSCNRARLGADFARKLIDDGTPLLEASDKIIDAIATPDDQHVDNRFSPGDGVREADFARVASTALLHRERIENTKDADALALAPRSLVELARQCAEMDGVGIPASTSRMETAKRALISSTTLGDVIAHTAGRSLATGYQAEPRVFAEIFRETSAQNFRPLERVKLSDVPALPLVAEGAEYTEATLTDSKETYSIASYGSIVAFTRQLVVNDDVDAITRVPQMLGAAAAARESDVFWAILNANGNMGDTNPIFAVGTSNFAVDALDAAALETAREEMQSQTSENGAAIGLQPKWLVVGPDLLTAAEKLIRPPVDYSTSTLADTLSTALANQLNLRVEPRLPAGTFYLFSDYRRFDTCEFAFLANQPGPYIEREIDFSTGALKLKMTLDFGAAAIDRRGLYRVDAT